MIVFVIVLGALLAVAILYSALWLADLLHALSSDKSSSMHARHHGMHGECAPKVGSHH